MSLAQPFDFFFFLFFGVGPIGLRESPAHVLINTEGFPLIFTLVL